MAEEQQSKYLSAVESENSCRLTDWKWIFLGGGLLLSVGSWTLLSGQFVFGEGHADRPIPAFLAAYALAWLAFTFGVIRLKAGKRPSSRFIIVIAILARFALLPSGLIQENDVYRYVLDGNALIRGQNPFEWPPGEVVSEAKGSLREALESPAAQLVLSRISYSHISTVYPPAAQAAFGAGALIGGWNWMGQRVVFLILDLLVIGMIGQLLTRLKAGFHWILLYAWNPLVLKEIINSAHFDVLVALFLLLAVWALIGNLRRSSGVQILLAALFLALAVLGKIYPLILMPWALILLRRNGEGLGRVVLFGILVMGLILIGWVPFLGIGWESLTAGFRAYAAQWRMNDGAFSLFQFVFPTAARLVSSCVIGLSACVIPWVLLKRATERMLVESAVWILLIWFLLIPTPYPWYSVPMIALATLNRRLVPLVMVLTGALVLYYLRFVVEYRHLPDEWWSWARGIEHAALWAGMLWVLFRGSTEDGESKSGPATKELAVG